MRRTRHGRGGPELESGQVVQIVRRGAIRRGRQVGQVATMTARYVNLGAIPIRNGVEDSPLTDQGDDFGARHLLAGAKFDGSDVLMLTVSCVRGLHVDPHDLVAHEGSLHSLIWSSPQARQGAVRFCADNI